MISPFLPSMHKISAVIHLKYPEKCSEKRGCGCKSLFLSTLDEKSWTLHETLPLQILLPY